MRKPEAARAYAPSVSQGSSLSVLIFKNSADTPYPNLCKLHKALVEFHDYIENNRGFIPNYGERWRYGERISTGVVESTVNAVVSKRFAKKQQMQWGKRGAHDLLQARVRVLNDELRANFEHWYPGFGGQESEELKLAA